MKVNVITKNGASALSVKVDFNDVLDENYDAICDAIANKGIILKELLNLYEEQSDEFIENVWLAPGMGRSAKKAEQFLSEGRGISQVSAHYLLNMPHEKISSLNAMKLKKMLEDYKAKISLITV